MRAFLLPSAAAIFILLGGCATDRAAPPPQASVPRMPPSPGTMARELVDSAAFIESSGSIELLIIRASELALQRSSSPRVRDFASTIINDHKGTSAQLSFAGRRLNSLPSASLGPREQMMLVDLESAANFEGAYVRLQRTAHQELLQLARDYARSGRSPTLLPVARAAIPIEERHLRLLAYL